MMMSSARRSQYKGLAITVQCNQLTSPLSRMARRFTASYFVAAKGVEHGRWHHLPESVFMSRESAVAHGLRKARQSIDAGEHRHGA